MPLYQKYSVGFCLFVISCSFLFACSSIKSSIKDDGKQIPPEFGKRSGTLLVVRSGRRSYDKYLESNFENNYFGKYEFIRGNVANSEMYRDKAKFRYIFSDQTHVEHPVFKSPVSGYMPDRYATFSVTDRLTGDVYTTKRGSGAFSKLMRAYIQVLEEVRQKK